MDLTLPSKIAREEERHWGKRVERKKGNNKKKRYKQKERKKKKDKENRRQAARTCGKLMVLPASQPHS